MTKTIETKTEVETPEVKVEEVMTLKNFRSNADIENFYRFIHDNGLRREAHSLISYVLEKTRKLRRSKKAKTLQ